MNKFHTVAVALALTLLTSAVRAQTAPAYPKRTLVAAEHEDLKG
jgi:hypothetical protein